MSGTGWRTRDLWFNCWNEVLYRVESKALIKHYRQRCYATRSTITEIRELLSCLLVTEAALLTGLAFMLTWNECGGEAGELKCFPGGIAVTGECGSGRREMGYLSPWMISTIALPFWSHPPLASPWPLHDSHHLRICLFG